MDSILLRFVEVAFRGNHDRKPINILNYIYKNHNLTKMTGDQKINRSH